MLLDNKLLATYLGSKGILVRYQFRLHKVFLLGWPGFRLWRKTTQSGEKLQFFQRHASAGGRPYPVCEWYVVESSVIPGTGS